MPSIISCRTISKSYGAQHLFSELDLNIKEGDRIGLIGPNGSGKSTLLKILSGLEDEDSGAILKKNTLMVSYLAQADRFQEDLGPLDNLLEPLKAFPLEEAEKLNRAQAMLSRVELNDHERPVRQLSGGWRKRLSICRALIVEPDLLIMDEPTNHLDIEGIVWLEKLFNSQTAISPSTFILVSHDRRFLENCANRIVELSSAYPAGTFQVDGKYSSFLGKKEQFLEQQHRLEEKLTNRFRREAEWLSRGPKARTTKARYRIDEAHRLHERLDTVKQQNRSDTKVAIDFTATGRKTKKLLEVCDLSGQYQENKLFSNLDLTITPGTRIGLVGRNGCGKSTLLNLLYSGGRGELDLEQGSIVAAQGLSIVHFVQDRSGINQNLSLRRALAPEGDSIVFKDRSVHVVSWAKRFLFRPDQLDTPVGRLSGGEQARILIAELMRQPADILLLDEPTNDLDIASLDVLEESLMEFHGAIILVTHDRYLLDRVCDRVLGFTGSGVLRMYGDYEQWLADLGDESEKSIATGKTFDTKRAEDRQNSAQHSDKPRKDKMAGRLSYLDQREYDQMEAKITAGEQSCERLEQLIADPSLAANPEKLQEVWSELEQVKNEVEGLYLRWDELERKKKA